MWYFQIGIQLSKLEAVNKDTRGYKSIESFLAPTAVNDSEGGVNKVYCNN